MYTKHVLQVKEKMLYAATKATIKKAFSSGIVIDDIAATHKVKCCGYMCMCMYKYMYMYVVSNSL